MRCVATHVTNVLVRSLLAVGREPENPKQARIDLRTPPLPYGDMIATRASRVPQIPLVLALVPELPRFRCSGRTILHSLPRSDTHDGARRPRDVEISPAPPSRAGQRQHRTPGGPGHTMYYVQVFYMVSHGRHACHRPGISVYKYTSGFFKAEPDCSTLPPPFLPISPLNGLVSKKQKTPSLPRIGSRPSQALVRHAPQWL